MFTIQERNRVRDRLLEIARADSRIVSAAFVGSSSTGGDRWSDLDLTFGISDAVDVSDMLDYWTETCKKEFQAVKLFDLVSGPSTYRVFLFSGNLQVDLSFTPSKDFGSAGPRFRLLWGCYTERRRAPPPSSVHLFGLAVHHLLRARICIERRRFWQAEYWIGEARNSILTHLCLQNGLETASGRGFDSLPVETREQFKETLVVELGRERLLSALSNTLDRLLSDCSGVDEKEIVAELERRLQELKTEVLA